MIVYLTMMENDHYLLGRKWNDYLKIMDYPRMKTKPGILFTKKQQTKLGIFYFFKTMDKTWTKKAPVLIVCNKHIFYCPRRFLWSPNATINSVERDCPIIPSLFDTVTNCATSYWQFYEMHWIHTDTPCLGAQVLQLS